MISNIRSKTNSHTYTSAELSKIFTLTMKLCNLNPKSTNKFRTPEGYWTKMMRLWKNNTDLIGFNVVYAALYGIYWGTYPKDFPNNQDLTQLVDLLRVEFQRVDKDTVHAKNKQLFTKSLNQVLKSQSPYSVSGKRWKSNYYSSFLEHKLNFKLYGGKIEVKNLNLVDTSLETFADMKDRAKSRFLFEQAKKQIARLIPDAISWLDDDFSNESLIIEHLKCLYGIDYCSDWRSFDCLMNVLPKLCSPNNNERYFILGVRSMPMSLAKVIWQDNTEKCIEELFCDSYWYIAKYLAFMKNRNAEYHDAIATAQCELMSTWVFRQIKDWYENKIYTISAETRKVYFNISMGIF